MNIVPVISLYYCLTDSLGDVHEFAPPSEWLGSASLRGSGPLTFQSFFLHNAEELGSSVPASHIHVRICVWYSIAGILM